MHIETDDALMVARGYAYERDADGSVRIQVRPEQSARSAPSEGWWIATPLTVSRAPALGRVCERGAILAFVCAALRLHEPITPWDDDTVRVLREDADARVAFSRAHFGETRAALEARYLARSLHNATREGDAHITALCAHLVAP